VSGYLKGFYPFRDIMKKSRMEPSPPLFKLKILPLRSLFVYKTLRIFYTRGGNVQNNMNGFSDRLRSALLVVPRPFKEAFRKSYDYLAAKLFNLLGLYQTQFLTVNIFCKFLRNRLDEIENIEELLK
jgi:hypothetical protein